MGRETLWKNRSWNFCLNKKPWQIEFSATDFLVQEPVCIVLGLEI